ncbi:arylamine N-acetyltransferase family protein [Sphingomonas jatrophae]|uniref:N-hydroxyarylamine O-acetyltransferase n=1 Tax=Sphingomonas jatrophae TaxID=1166337 RepID=A0A1I6K545_9SPHN|nr:arylamine N-acetyltransferase [Sphingomonas jatrophae]SFR86274.1 N-hydroxyarylamine O-acetyltransferase [Sphingomonas jatrophae]
MLDLPAYLARIALPLAPEPDAEGLATLQRAHRLAIPFENLDIPLGRGISLDPDAVFDKLVTRSRGGYCFEQNSLFLRALHAIGFDARPLLARVWLGQSEVPPKTHTLSLVTLDGQEWIADAGFGGSYTPPMPLIDGTEAATPDGARHRLRRDADHGWMLERHGHAETTDGRGSHDGWVPQYSFTEERVWPADLAMANHFAATVPGGRFTTHRIVSIVLPSGFASLTDRHYTRRNGERGSAGEITDARTYRMRLSLMFGLHLTVEEVDGLGLF